MYAVNTLINQFARFIMTTVGIALCIILMLFLISIYHGISNSSVRYVRESEADLWVLQRHAANILRGTSLLTYRHGKLIKETPGVKSVSPILFFTATLNWNNNSASVHLTGFDPRTGIGGPHTILSGSNIKNDDEIVLDNSFAAKYRIHVGDKLPVKDDTLNVVGLSGGTNMFVIQYAFISLKKAQLLLGFQRIASCYQVKLDPGYNSSVVADSILSKMSDVAVYDKETFLQNNIHEAQTGVLPVIYVIAMIGTVVLTAILSLILSVHVLEQRKDYAIMKALGASDHYIIGVVIKQSLILAGCGMVIAFVAFFPLIKIIEKLSPTVSAETTLSQFLIVIAGLFFISIVSAFFPYMRLRHIYPLEVFN